MKTHLPPDGAIVPSVPDAAALTVRQAIDLYRAHDTRRKGRSEEAARERERLWDEFCSALGDRRVSDCRAADLQFWIDQHPDWQSDWTLGRVVRTIQRPLNWLAGLGVISRNPFASIRHPPGERGRAMTAGEFQNLLRHTDACFRRVLVALRWSGMRPGELRQLQWEHVDFERGCAVLARHKTAKSRKDRKPRTIVLHPVLVRLLIWIRRSQPHRPHIFVNARGRPWGRHAVDLRFKRLRIRCAIDASCKLYSTRHAFATQAATRGVDLATLAALLGHTTTQMASYYVHVSGQLDHLQQAVLRAAGNAPNPRQKP